MVRRKVSKILRESRGQECGREEMGESGEGRNGVVVIRIIIVLVREGRGLGAEGRRGRGRGKKRCAGSE